MLVPPSPRIQRTGANFRVTIAIDASRAAGEQKTGVGWYTYHLLTHLVGAIPNDVGVLLYSDAPLPQCFPTPPASWNVRVLPWYLALGTWRMRLPFWSQIRLAWQVLRDRPDVLFIPAHVVPDALAFFRWCGIVTTRMVTTVHDVAFQSLSRAYALRERWYADHATRIAVHAADRIIVPTESVRRDLIRWYGANPERVVAIHHGVSFPMLMTERPVRTSGATTNHGSVRTILYVGRLEYKKNIARVISAFDRIAAAHPELDLVLAGGSGHGHGTIADRIARSSFRDRIRTPGWVDDATYHALLTSASVFIFPTLAEGFGIPIIEAMAAGVPVVTSRGHAHEEVAGDAAVLVNPTSIEEIARGIERALDPRERGTLVHRGKQRVRAYTWERAAQSTWETMRGVLSA